MGTKEWDMQKVLAHYGLDVLLTSGKLPVRCPFHDDRSASATATSAWFKCHTCGVKGDAIAVIMKVDHVDFSGALERYERITGDRGGRVSKPARRKSWGVPPFESGHNPKDDGGFSARVRKKPDFWT